MIVTISRQYAAGGSEVAHRVAEALDYALVDNQLIDVVAARAGMTREEVADREERAPGFIDRLTHTLTASMPEFIAPEGGTLPDLTEERLVRITETVVSVPSSLFTRFHSFFILTTPFTLQSLLIQNSNS